MQPNRLFSCHFLLIFLFCFSAQFWGRGAFLSAQQINHKNQGETAASFLDVNPGVQLSALGGHQAAYRSSLENLFANPAGLSSLQTPSIWLTHNESFLSTRYETIGMAGLFKENAFGIAAQYIDDGRQDRYDVDAANNEVGGLGEFRPYASFLQLSWARAWKNKFSVGVSAKGWKENLDKNSSLGWASDMGLLFSLTPRLDIGLLTRNNGPSFNGFELPRRQSIGVAYQQKVPLMKTMGFYSDIEHSASEGAMLRTGVEIARMPFWLRGGYKKPFSSDVHQLGRFSLGAGFRIRSVKIDYAWEDGEDLGQTHRMALTIHLGLTPEEKEAAAKIINQGMAQRMKERSLGYLLAGQRAADEENWAAAIQEYSKAVLWDPGNEEGLNKLNEAQQKQRTVESEAHYKEGLSFVQQKRWIDATLSFQEALKLNPQHAQAAQDLKNAEMEMLAQQTALTGSNQNGVPRAYNKGVLNYINGNFDEALKEWGYVLQNFPEWPNIQEYMAKAKSKKLEQQLKAQELTMSEEKDPEMLSQQAYAFFAAGNVDQAIATWKRVLEIEPANKDALWAIKEAQEKKSLFNGRAPQPASANVEGLNGEALREYVGGRLENAAKIWRRALEMDPGNRKIRNSLLRVQNELSMKGAKR